MARLSRVSLAFCFASFVSCATRRSNGPIGTLGESHRAPPLHGLAERNDKLGASGPTSPIEPTRSPVPIPSATATSEPNRAPEGMLLVPGGTFDMGTDAGGEEDEHPAHRVTLSDFWLDVTEVTVQDYTSCMKAGICAQYRQDSAKSFGAGDDGAFRQPLQPISGISWDQALTYCQYRGKRLPREAEWERAARGDDNRRYPWGNSPPDPAIHGCFARHVGTPSGTTCDVGSYPKGAGPFGHLDLAGNVWEWMSDYYDPMAYRRLTSASGEPGSCEQIVETQNWLRKEKRQGFTGTNPIPTDCERVLRGGAFNYPATGLRASNRVHHPGHWRLLMAGVRCAKSISQ